MGIGAYQGIYLVGELINKGKETQEAGQAIGNSATQNILQLIFMIIVFVAVLALCIYTTRFVAGKQLRQVKKGNFELIEGFAVAQNQFLQLVKIGKKYVVIGVTKEQITYITEIDKEDVVDTKSRQDTHSLDFKNILSNFTSPKNKERDDAQDEADREEEKYDK